MGALNQRCPKKVKILGSPVYRAFYLFIAAVSTSDAEVTCDETQQQDASFLLSRRTPSKVSHSQESFRHSEAQAWRQDFPKAESFTDDRHTFIRHVPLRWRELNRAQIPLGRRRWRSTFAPK